ncbi:hypothetical protein ABIF65_004282 [Bradyrhizobium japonicum]|jgi:hypothetical protein|uniref:hypothetical protein n=1 Tax=Bradyrhizobium TaxID=374 RepID=UPI00041037D8|nr:MULTISPECIES: hypothetical protein [Bradyrhizobium]MBR0883066.1 hypothetical protein [Bradyrhizobium liaoningense]MBR0946854.1 hypothetical protein [Bradyrhizobium liaoningense]MBR0999979.1 hypothetical protein [Bradyrhizobium liaoningense]MBR1033900.1 hypothetical protein [Bradyrhizobium liaoningense]MBR1069316.1 hypothetical protein [Bradyrhizobium liaoningense]
MRALALAAFLIGLPATAFAGGGFDIVVPGRPGVPIIIDNIDASYSVVEGVWGLGKNVQVQPTIYGGRYIAERQPEDVGHYYPTMGLRPGYGRLEVEPPANRKLPKPAESYHQSWDVQSAPLPPQMDVPVNPPPVIFAPEINDRPRRPRPRPHAQAPGRPPT